MQLSINYHDFSSAMFGGMVTAAISNQQSILINILIGAVSGLLVWASTSLIKLVIKAVRSRVCKGKPSE